MKILIIGGTGVLSYDFTRTVIDNGHDIYLLNRGRTSSDFIDKCHFINADIRNEDSKVLKKKLTSNMYDIVVDFLSYDSMQVKRIVEVLDCCYKNYVFISTAMVYGENSKGISIDESSRVVRGIWDYADKKIDAENYVINNVNNYLIIRPYITYGESRIPYQLAPDRYYYTLIKRILDGKPVPLVDKGEAFCNLTNTIDFANILYKLIISNDNYNEIYNIVSDEIVKWKDIYNCICSILNVKPNVFSIDLDEVRKYLPEYYDSLRCGKGIDYIVSGKKAEVAIGGYSYNTTMEQGIKRSLMYYIENIEHQGIDYRWDGRIDYAYRKIAKKVCKIYPTKGNKEKSTSIGAYYFMQNVLLRKIYKFVKKGLYE